MNSITLDLHLEMVAQRNRNEPEFVQAVGEVMASVWDLVEENPRYRSQALLERMIEPERVIQFRVPWIDDRGQVQVNRGWRVQFNSAIGPFKGGIRFHPSVYVGILKFLGFEQIFKNALTTLPMGGGKGGSDFDPKGKSDNEVMRFCQAFISELHRHLGPDTDIPAGDIGVGAREVGFMTGMMKKLSNNASCVFTGKGLSFGGSLMRTEATGYGVVYFVNQALKHNGKGSIKDKRVLVSGSGNVAQYAVEKCIQLGARVFSVSDSGGTVILDRAFDVETLSKLREAKNKRRIRLKEFALEIGARFFEGQRPWDLMDADVALPCATQNEIEIDDAKALIRRDLILLGEGANMPTTHEATRELVSNGVIVAPAKAANAGGVATSGLEMTQNAIRYSWTRDEVDSKLKSIMSDIHANCVKYGSNSGKVDYIKGANRAGFVKIADAMLAQGVI